jgi:hypothetical protein
MTVLPGQFRFAKRLNGKDNESSQSDLPVFDEFLTQREWRTTLKIVRRNFCIRERLFNGLLHNVHNLTAVLFFLSIVFRLNATNRRDLQSLLSSTDSITFYSRGDCLFGERSADSWRRLESHFFDSPRSPWSPPPPPPATSLHPSSNTRRAAADIASRWGPSSISAWQSISNDPSEHSHSWDSRESFEPQQFAENT